MSQTSKKETEAAEGTPASAAGTAPATRPGREPSASDRPFGAFQDELERLFRAFTVPHMPWSGGLLGSEGTIGLRVDIAETDGEIEVKADLPGISEDEVEVTLEDDMLRIRAEKKSESEKGDKTWRVVERSHGLFERAIRVPPGIDADKVAAHFEKGVLSVTLPKPAETKPSTRRISVQQAK